MPVVYVVEDDEDINDLLVYNLQKEGFTVFPFLSSVEALKSLTENKPDIILLDIMLPDIDGLEFCKMVKSNPETESIPIIMITAKSTEIDKIVGLELGADDYITKPFSIREVIARIRAILRRTSRKGTDRGSIKIKGLEIYPDRFNVVVDGKTVNLTAKEFKLLMLLINSDGRVLSRDYILQHGWNMDDVYDRTVDVHIKKLRGKLGRYGEYIKTVRGVGYRWNTD